MGDVAVSRSHVAIEIDGDDAAWLRGQQLPEGAEILEADEVEFWGHTYDRAPGSALYVPAHEDAPERVIARTMRRIHDEVAAARPIGVDLFAGCGGFSLGMHEGGFDVRAAVEWDEAREQLGPEYRMWLSRLARIEDNTFTRCTGFTAPSIKWNH